MEYQKDIRPEIIDEWFNGIIAGYPPETRRFLETNRDPFSNPVGSILKNSLGILLDQILGEMNDKVLKTALGDYLKIRAVQDCMPSEALQFLFLLKGILHDFGGEDQGPKPGREGVEALERRIDTVTLVAFDIYMKCREDIFSIRVKEIRNQVFGVPQGRP